MVRVLLRSWLTDDWEQVRGLSYLAVSKNDLDLLIRISGSKKHFKSFGLTCNEESVINLFRRYRSNSPKSNLDGVIERRTFSLEMGTDPFDGVSSELTFARDERRDEAYDIIHEAYRRHKIGLRKVKEPFIRNSTRIDGPPSIEPSDSPPAHRINIFTSSSGESFVYNHNIHIPECRFIVVVADCNEIGFPDPPVEVCFSMVSGPPKTPTASDVMKALHETLRANLPVYKTSLYAKPSLSGEWNLSATYGGGQTPYQSERIQTWIDHLSKKTGYFP